MSHSGCLRVHVCAMRDCQGRCILAAPSAPGSPSIYFPEPKCTTMSHPRAILGSKRAPGVHVVPCQSWCCCMLAFTASGSSHLVAYGFMMSYQGWQVIGAGVTGPEISPAKRGWSGPNARGDARQARFNSCRASLRLTDIIRRRSVEAIAQLCLRDQPSSSILVHRHARSASEQTLLNK